MNLSSNDVCICTCMRGGGVQMLICQCALTLECTFRVGGRAYWNFVGYGKNKNHLMSHTLTPLPIRCQPHVGRAQNYENSQAMSGMREHWQCYKAQYE